MNTPSHLVVNLAALSPGRNSGVTWPVAIGAVFPDLPILLFYLYERFVAGAGEALIWNELYFRPGWQGFIDVFNSIPLALGGLLLAAGTHHRRWKFFFASVLLHCAFDLPLHHDDAHRHFYPFSDYRFASIVSYWDPRHFGRLAAAAEIALVAAASSVLWRHHPGLVVRCSLMGLNGLYVALYLLFYWYRPGLLP